MQSKTFDLLNIEFSLLNRICKRIETDTLLLALSALQIVVPESSPSKNDIDVRFSARFGSPPRIRLHSAKSNRWEQKERNEKIFVAYCTVLGSILGRQATNGEVFGYEEIAESRRFVTSEK